LAICVLVLMRDQFAHFLRSFAEAKGQSGESYELTRLRALVASPMAVVLYAYAFYLPAQGWEWFYRALNWLDQLPLRMLYVVEILFLLINTVSVTLYLRKYGRLALNDICEDNEVLRRRILAIFPNALTLMNGLLGIVAMVFADHGRVREALFILLGAAFFDKLDGSVARKLGLTEPLPEESPPPGMRLGPLLDDLSDAISFCIAPAAIYYMVMENLGFSAPGFPLWVIGLIYSLAGLTRLVFFTLDKSPIPGFFKGMPVPAAAMLTVPAVEVAHQLNMGGSEYAAPWAALTTAVMLLAAAVMNLYPIRYLHLGRWIGRHPNVMWTTIVAALVLVFTPYFGMTLFAGGLLYLFSPLTTGHIDPSIAQLEQPRTR
jgi:phosphatidylserine synthase